MHSGRRGAGGMRTYKNETLGTERATRCMVALCSIPGSNPTVTLACSYTNPRPHIHPFHGLLSLKHGLLRQHLSG